MYQHLSKISWFLSVKKFIVAKWWDACGRKVMEGVRRTEGLGMGGGDGMRL